MLDGSRGCLAADRDRIRHLRHRARSRRTSRRRSRADRPGGARRDHLPGEGAGCGEGGRHRRVIYNNRDGNFFGTLGEDANLPPFRCLDQPGGRRAICWADRTWRPEAVLRLDSPECRSPTTWPNSAPRGPNNDGWIKPESGARVSTFTPPPFWQAPIPGGGMPDPSGYERRAARLWRRRMWRAVALIRQARPS